MPEPATLTLIAVSCIAAAGGASWAVGKLMMPAPWGIAKPPTECNYSPYGGSRGGLDLAGKPGDKSPFATI